MYDVFLKDEECPPYIVTLSDRKDPGVMFFPFASGGDLKSWWPKRLALVGVETPWDLSLRKDFQMVLWNVLEGLLSLHNKELAAADFKWANVVVEEDEAGLVAAKLIDYESAVEIGTVHPACGGYTPPFSPHEFFVGESWGEINRNYTVATSFDVFSFGCLVYRLIMGDTTPLREKPQDEINTSEFEEVIKSKLKLGDTEFVEALASALSRCLSTDPSLRPTIEQLLVLLAP